jgi:hypothetical protein
VLYRGRVGVVWGGFGAEMEGKMVKIGRNWYRNGGKMVGKWWEMVEIGIKMVGKWWKMVKMGGIGRNWYRKGGNWHKNGRN